MTRAGRLEGELAGRGLDALLVTDPFNLRWLTGYTGSSGLAVVGPGARHFVTDFRYVEQAAAQVPDFDRTICERELFDSLPGIVAAGRLGFDDAHLSVKAHADLGERLPGVELVPAAGLVEDHRMVKDAGEIERIAAAAALADAALAEIVEAGLVGRTEGAISLALEQRMRELGAQAPSFSTIVASGAHGSLPHAEPRDVEVAAAAMVTIDWGARLDGYCSDCTRTFATGELEPEALEIYGLVLRAQEESLAAVAPGRSGRELDAVARDIITAAGHGPEFGHGLGHGVGLDIHEAPRLSRSGDTAVASGHVVTVEPGVYLPGRLGVRIEDLVVVTDEGHRVLTGIDKQLTTVD